MATPNVESFKTLGLPGSGARANLFEISFTDDSSVAFPSVKFLAKAGQIPGSTISILPINHGGRVLKIPGLRTFDDWTCTIINDDEMKIRRGLIDWMVTLSGGLQGSRASTPSTVSGNGIRLTGGTTGYKTQDITIKHFDSSGGEFIHEYKMVKAWPNAIADVPLDWSTDGIQEYTVTWSYDYWTSTMTTLGQTSIGTGAPSITNLTST